MFRENLHVFLQEYLPENWLVTSSFKWENQHRPKSKANLVKHEVYMHLIDYTLCKLKKNVNNLK